MLAGVCFEFLYASIEISMKFHRARLSVNNRTIEIIINLQQSTNNMGVIFLACGQSGFENSLPQYQPPQGEFVGLQMAKIHNVSTYPEYSAAVEEVQVRSPKIFAYFYGNDDPSTKKSWCPDCVLADPIIKQAFKAASPDLEIVRVAVGERAAWKTPDNEYRLKTKIKCIPTLIKLEDGVETGRLEELDCAAPEKVNNFLKS